MNKECLEKYARLAVKTGINIQKGQTLVISCPIECAFFARAIAKEAYIEGAHDVVMNYKDELFRKLRFENAPTEVFSEFPEWQKEFYISLAKGGAAFISIYAEDPELLKDVDPTRIATAQKTASLATKEYSDRLMSNKNVWSVISIPTESWAVKVFPELSKEEAVEKLWESIFKTVRVDREDPVEAWNVHKNNLKKRMDFLNKNQFKSLHYKNSLGTDLTVELPKGHIWLGGSDFSKDGVEFMANMPTEEIFTLPKRDGVNGTVVASKPLNCNGTLVDGFKISFKDGKIVDLTAEKGYESLKNLIETDDGSHYLGEVALVPNDSPISNSNILFLNTLFDENASCHLAIGKAYPVCLNGGEDMQDDELLLKGVNNSLVHEDFMVGSADLEIVGTTWEGKEIQVFTKGNFAF